MKVSKKYMFQKIKFLQNNKYFIMEVQEQIEKRRKMGTAREKNLFIERNHWLLMKHLMKIMKLIRNSKTKKEQACCLCFKG